MKKDQSQTPATLNLKYNDLPEYDGGGSRGLTSGLPDHGLHNTNNKETAIPVAMSVAMFSLFCKIHKKNCLLYVNKQRGKVR